MPFTPLHTQDSDLNRVQAGVRTAVAGLESGILSKAILSSSITIGTADTRVDHNLGYAPKGWFIVSPSAAATVYAGAVANEPAKYINLMASVAVTCKVIFF